MDPQGDGVVKDVLHLGRESHLLKEKNQIIHFFALFIRMVSIKANQGFLNDEFMHNVLSHPLVAQSGPNRRGRN